MAGRRTKVTQFPGKQFRMLFVLAVVCLMLFGVLAPHKVRSMHPAVSIDRPEANS